MQYYLSFDCEATGITGEPFCVGWVVVDQESQELQDGYLACPVDEAAPEQDLQWVREHVLPCLPHHQDRDPVYANCRDLPELLRRFWHSWIEAQSAYPEIVLVTDCPFPVEAGFLLRVANEMNLSMRDLPYPVLDVASVLAAAGYNPIATLTRKPNELPAHNPVRDARQSIRIMLGTMGEISRDRSLGISHGHYKMVDQDGNPWPSPGGIVTSYSFTESVEPDPDKSAPAVTYTKWTPPEDA